MRNVFHILIMLCHSFFGTQEGDFSLSIRSISALAEVPDQTYAVAARDSNGLEKGLPAATARAQPWDKLPVVLVASLCLFAVYYFTGRHSCRLGPSNVV
jgi:hypothetical protein